MKKANLNFTIDAVAFTAFVLVASTGVLMRYVLPPGSGHFSTLWGMDRHDWGQLHFWIAVLLMVSLGLHLFLHWRWIACMLKGQPREGSGIRVALSVVAVLILAALAGTPFLGKLEQSGEPPHKLRSTASEKSADHNINGSMTLADVEQLTGIPTAVMLRELGLPENIPMDTQLGRLRKEYGFELQAVREIIRKHAERK